MALSFDTTGKYTSERHEIAKQSGKLTAGEAAKMLRKSGFEISAKELVEAYKLINGYEPEWHHAGFYSGSNGSTMGRTFFFTETQIEQLKPRLPEVESIKSKKEAEMQIKRENTVKGFYFAWDYDYGGNYGKKRNFKVLKVYEGSELARPKNFTTLSDEEFEVAKTKAGKKYFGWDEPSKSEFQQVNN